MRLKRTIVEVILPRINAKGNPVDKNNREYDVSSTSKTWEQAMDSVRFYLLHWGLTYSVLYNENNHPYAVSYTAAICQEIKGGRIYLFQPQEIRVIEQEAK